MGIGIGVPERRLDFDPMATLASLNKSGQLRKKR